MKGVIELKAIIPRIRAVIFDMDGVLVDSESQHYRAHKAAIEEAGGALTKEFYSAHGVSRDPLLLYADCFPDRGDDKVFLGRIYARKLQMYQQLQEKEGILPVKPAVLLGTFLYQKHVPLAVGTAVHKDEAMRNLRALHVDHLFKAVVTFDEAGEKRKPAPDIYLRVAELLKIPPASCLVIEDSENGVKAAVGAGMSCVVVPNDFTRGHDFDGAIIISSFEEIQKIFEERYK